MYRYILDNYLFASLYFLNFDIFYRLEIFRNVSISKYLLFSGYKKRIIVIKRKIFVNIFLGFYTMYNSSKG